MSYDRIVITVRVSERIRLADLYANCDVFIHPNPREPFGIAPLEAMASGLSLIAPETGRVRTYASGDNAWLVPDDPVAYARAVVDASSRNGACERVVRALRTAGDHAWPIVCRRYLRLYEEIHQHRLIDRNPSQPAAFYSTLGTLLGCERAPAAQK
jgi:glycosyltransferase involved in cell wall biosynthesis